MATVALNYGETELHPESVSNIKPLKNKYNWKGINYPSKIADWKMSKKNNPIIALNIWCIKEKEICSAYISKINSNYEKQTILLMIPGEEKKRLALYFSKKTIYIIKRNNIKTSWCYLLLELTSLCYNQKQTYVSWKYVKIKIFVEL